MLLVGACALGLCGCRGAGPEFGSSADEQLHLASAAELRHDEPSARRHYEAVLTHDPANVPALQRLAFFELRSGRAGRAVSYLGRAAEIAPRDSVVLPDLARALVDRGYVDEVVPLLARAVAAGNPHPTPLNLLVFLCHDRPERLAAAEAEWRRVLGARPSELKSVRQRVKEAQEAHTRARRGPFKPIDRTHPLRQRLRPPPMHDTDPRLLKLIGGAC